MIEVEKTGSVIFLQMPQGGIPTGPSSLLLESAVTIRAMDNSRHQLVLTSNLLGYNTNTIFI